jgi:hypothetical protein
VVFSHVTAALGSAWDELNPLDPAVGAAVSGLRRGCTAAKEALSADTEVLIPVVLPGIDTRIRLARTEFEEAIRPAIDETVTALRRAIAVAGVEPDAVLLVGGSARIPLITQTVSERLGRPVSVALDPKGIVAIGAAIEARGPIAAPTRMLPAAPVPAGTAVDESPRVLPMPIGPPRADNSGRWLGMPRIVVTAVAASVVAAGVAGGLTVLAHHTRPASSDANTVTRQAPRTESPTTRDQPAVRNRPPVQTTTAPGARKPEPTTPPPRTTSAPTDSSSTPPTSRTTTTLSSPPSASTRASAR